MLSPTRRGALQALGAAATLPAIQGDVLGKPRKDGSIHGKMSGARALVETLQSEGVACVYGIPGAQENELWDAMKQMGLPYLLSTHEYGAASMADGYARSTGRPGVLAVVPGPGVTNAATGLGEALLDSVPIVALVGDVARGEKYRSFQVHEIPVHLVLQGVTKKVLHCPDVSQIPCVVREAFRLSMDGEPGPVAVMIPYTQLVDAVRF
ncbi:MAG: thiamine pyrophosphate-binding protein, partial [Planctomycetota bacterium]